MRRDPKLIGLLGKKRSGKSSAAQYLFNKYCYCDVQWAYPLKEIIGAELFRLSWDQMYGGDEFKEAIDPRWGKSPREILQTVGTELFRNQFDPDFWVKQGVLQIEERWHDGETVVVSDCRFPNEVKKITEMGGITVRIVRIDAPPAVDEHLSETALDDYKADFTLEAHDGIENIHRLIDELLED